MLSSPEKSCINILEKDQVLPSVHTRSTRLVYLRKFWQFIKNGLTVKFYLEDLDQIAALSHMGQSTPGPSSKYIIEVINMLHKSSMSLKMNRS